MSTPESRGGWKKSSYADTRNGCVEVFRTLGAVRDSKQEEGPEPAVDVRGLVGMVKSGGQGLKYSRHRVSFRFL